MEMELGYIVRIRSFLGLKLFPHTGKSPWQGTDLQLLHDLMKQEISLAGSTSAWPEIKVTLNRAILFGMHAVQAAVNHVTVPVNAMCVFLLELYQSKANNNFMFSTTFMYSLPCAESLSFHLYLYTCMYYINNCWPPS